MKKPAGEGITLPSKFAASSQACHCGPVDLGQHTEAKEPQVCPGRGMGREGGAGNREDRGG